MLSEIFSVALFPRYFGLLNIRDRLRCVIVKNQLFFSVILIICYVYDVENKSDCLSRSSRKVLNVNFIGGKLILFIPVILITTKQLDCCLNYQTNPYNKKYVLCYKARYINFLYKFQQMYVTSRSNILAACMKLFDCFMHDFHDEKYVESLSDLDIRAQLEVSYTILFL